MSMETRSTKRNRVYKRKFDHELAIEMHEKGFTYGEIARHLGNIVTPTAIARVCDPKIRARMDAQVLRNLMSGSCVDCGAACSKLGPRCKSCASKAKQTRFIINDDDEIVAVRCFTCKQWKPRDMFQSAADQSRGVYRQCRACSTKKRQEYRLRRKVPCLYCGAPALPPEEKGASGSHEPRCRECYREHQLLQV